VSGASERISQLRKAGRTDEAYELAKSLLREDEADFELRKSLGWVLY